MKIKYFKLKKNKQLELKKLFLANVSARKADAIVDVHRNTSSLFYRKMMEIIANETINKEEKNNRLVAK